MRSASEGRKVTSVGWPVLEFSFRNDDGVYSLNDIPMHFAQPTVGQFARHNPNAIQIGRGSDPFDREDFNVG
jgi:hypothetical protein